MKIRFVIATALLLSACTTSNEIQVSEDMSLDEIFEVYQSQDVEWVDCDSDLLVTESTDALFSAANVQCAKIEIPFHYAAATAGENLSLTIMKDPAMETGENYKGVLFLNPGGPGQSGIDFLQTAPLPAEIRNAYDVIGVDPRGVGASSPVRCSDELDLRSYYEYPLESANAAEAETLETFMKNFYEDCAAANPHWWTIGTDNVVKDFELLRRILTPAAKFNFIGHSYGTTIAGRYITEFPEQVGRIVLDSPVKPDDGEITTDLEQVESLTAARTRIFEKCATDTACPGETVAEVEANLIKIRDAILADETEGFVYEAMGGSDFFKAGNGESAYLVVRAISLLTYWPIADGYKYFKQMYKDGLDGWIGGFEYFGLYMDGYDPETLERDNSYEVLTIVNCLDIDSRDTRSESEIDAESAQFEAADPFETEFFDVSDYESPAEAEPGCYWSWEAFDDTTIPDPPASQPDFENTSGQGVITIGSQGDNVTPYAWSEVIASSLKSDLITYIGTGHAVLWGISSCIDNPVTEFLLNGTLPGDITCTE